jgi:O-acetylhomoserine (thiol)-lyase
VKNPKRARSTTALHGGYAGDGATGATAVPIYQTVAYAYRTARELEEAFAGTAPGYIYTRIANPTTAVLEARLAELEGGIGCVATASGMAAIASVATALLRSGDGILAARGIFGGTWSLFARTLARFGVTTRMESAADAGRFAAAITPRTRMVFVESVANPGMDVPDLSAIAREAHRAGLPLVVDATAATPFLCRPGEFGADLVVHSTSKFINGHGTAIGGAIIDTGAFDWTAGPFADLAELAKTAGRMAFLAGLRRLVYRDLGGCPAPMNSFLMLQGLETLGARMDLHCTNAARLAARLAETPGVAWVRYPGLPDDPAAAGAKAVLGGRGGALLTFGLGTRERAMRCIDALDLARNAANIGDVRTLVIHPASTIFREFNADERSAMGVSDDMIRVSVGLEDPEDILGDFEHAIGRSGEQ